MDAIYKLKVRLTEFFNLFLQFKVKAVGHFRKITGLAFSLELNILVSAAADAEVSTVSFVNFSTVNTKFPNQLTVNTKKK